METYKTEEYKTYKIAIVQDDDVFDPRKWDNFGKMACFHKRYSLGDKHNFTDPADLISFLKKEKAIYLPLYLYDHSGITIATTPFSCQWDSGQIGYIYVTRQDILKEFTCKKITKDIKQKVINLLESEVETYDRYLTGEVYGFTITDKSGDIIDSCYGYYDTPDNISKEVKKNIDKYYDYQLELTLT